MRFEYFNLLQLQGSRAWFVTSEPKQTEAVFQICTTLFIATLLFGMFILFSRDVTSMVVRPIESMIDIVRKLAQNPTLKLEGQTKSKYETEAVRIALAKIVGLMQLGFGGAHPSPNPHPSPDPDPNPNPDPDPNPNPNPNPNPDPNPNANPNQGAARDAQLELRGEMLRHERDVQRDMLSSQQRDILSSQRDHTSLLRTASAPPQVRGGVWVRVTLARIRTRT